MSSAGAIGIFDSGVGGLTVLHEMRRALPAESTVYLGDIARFPYGPRPQSEVRLFARAITRFLIEDRGVKVVVVACNTASAAALEPLRLEFPGTPIIGVVEPGARAAVAASGSGRIGVIATAGTVASGAYPRAIAAMAPGASLVAQACPELVGLAERGETDGPTVERLLHHYLDPLNRSGIDTLILGCTHYPLLRPAIDRVIGRGITVVDSAYTTAVETALLLRSMGLEAPGSATGHPLLTTGSPSQMQSIAARLFGDTVEQVETVALALPAWGPVSAAFSRVTER